MDTQENGTRNERLLNIGLWAAQIVLAVVFTVAGAFKVFVAPEALLAKAPDLAALPLMLIRFIGIAELAAAAGLILPSLTRIAPKLTPLAALCVLPIMAGALAFNVKAGHLGPLVLAIVCSALVWFVAWARSTRAPIAPRKTLAMSAAEGA